MYELSHTLWIELLKVRRSRVPLFLNLGFMILPLGIGFFMIVYKYPDLVRQMGLISAKANLAGGSADWPFYLGMYAQAFGVAGLVLNSLIASWVFGREFSDGTVKDLLAVPVSRGAVVAAKYLVAALWALVQTAVVYGWGLLIGVIIGMPQGNLDLLARQTGLIAMTNLLVLVATTPVGFFACAGRGYLAPMGLSILILGVGNILAVLGWGSYFPWAIPGIYAGMTGTPGVMEPTSLWILLATGVIGAVATYLWWKYADQNR